ncbi:MAG TPA: prolyl oligopeptidase family serine peptidase [Candidatus Dormibacteraeota bacterium]|nr:prolyl oligopeptidase family serine peptidase [Candidatus Dormibacteraeota bacterium]
MIGIFNSLIDSIPCLVIVDQDKKDKALPMVIYSHGFTSAKEHNLPIAYLLAEAGFRVVLPDSEYHGEREIKITSSERQVSFWDIVMKNVEEFATIKNYFENKELILDGRIGIAGTSMGGISTSAALTQYPWIKVAVVLMGSPKITTYAKTLVSSFKKMGDLPVTDEMIEHLYERLETYDLSQQVHKLDHRPLLFWHGENDAVVPFDHSYTFYDEVKELYDDPKKIHFIREVNRDHKVSRSAILKTVQWFEKYL